MEIEIRSKDGTGMLDAFAKQVGSSVDNGRVEVPEKFGIGYMRGFNFGYRLRLIILDYELKQDFAIVRRNQSSEMLIFSLRNVIGSSKISSGPKLSPSVQITTQGLNAEMFVPKNTVENSITLSIEADYLRE